MQCWKRSQHFLGTPRVEIIHNSLTVYILAARPVRDRGCTQSQEIPLVRTQGNYKTLELFPITWMGLESLYPLFILFIYFYIYFIFYLICQIQIFSKMQRMDLIGKQFSYFQCTTRLLKFQFIFSALVSCLLHFYKQLQNADNG